MKRLILSKIKFITLLILVIIIASQAISYAQTEPGFTWAHNIGGSGYESIEDIVTDTAGNVLVIGSFENTILIGSTTLVSNGGYDIFFAKFDQVGNPIFAVQAGGPEYDVGESIAIDTNGDIVLTGTFSGTASFGSTNLSSRGSFDVFIAKYSPSGILQWVDRAGGQGFELVGQIATDNLNNIFITGTFEFTATFDTISVIGGDLTSIYLAKYNSLGRVQWVRTGINSLYSIASNGIATNSTNEVYITGSFESSINFSGTILTGQDGSDIFVNKYSTDGTLLWAIPVTGLSFYDAGRDVCVGEDDMIYVTGSFGETVTFGNFTLNSSSLSDIFVVKYTPDGDPLWAIQDAIQQNDHQGNGVAVDRAGNVSVISQIPQEFLTAEINNIYLSRYNKNGQKLWGLICGGLDNDTPGKITVDINGDIVACGTFYESGTFGNIILNSSGFYDGFFGKLPSPDLIPNDRSIDFGAVAVGSTNNINLIINNTSNATLHISGSVIAGLNPSEFSLTQVPNTIAPLQSQTLSVGFNPLANGLRTAYIIFESDAPTSPDTVFLSGQAGALSISLSTNLIDYGSVDTSEFSERTLIITNTGSGEVIVLLPVILGINQSDFSVVDLTSYPDTLLPQEVKNINVRFSPNSTGNRSAQLQILSNAPSSPDIVDLQGTGMGALVEITLSDNLLDFGTVDIDNFSERTLTITNTGTQNVIIDSASIIPVSQSDFSIVSTQFPISLLPEEIVNISIRFSPTTPGDKLSQLQIISNVPGSPGLVDLEGNAVTGITVQLPTPPQVGQNVSMNILPPAGFLATSGEIFYRQTGDLNYINSPLTLQGSDYLANIPAQFSTIKGIQYYIVFNGSPGSVTFPSTNPASQPAVLQVNVPVFPFQGTIPNAEYRMVSIPVSANNPDIFSVFGDDYGQYDSTQWRIFRWNHITGAYDEFPESDLTPGNAFWLIHKEGKTFDVENAMSVQSSSDFIITLQANSWTQIGNPFAFEVDFNPDLEIDSLSLYRWNIDSLEYEMNQIILEPWEGYFVRNDNDIPVILSIPPIRSTIEKQIPKIVTFSGGEFVVQIKTNVEGSRYKDNQNYVGMINDKKNIYAANLLEPPPITSDIRLSIVEDNKYFAQKTVSVNSDGSSWNLQLSTSRRNKNIHFNFDYLNTLPDGFSIYLLDVDRQIAIPIDNNSAEIKITDEDKINLKLIIGTEQFAKNNSQNISLTPTEYMVSQNYPNPFNPTTSIVYNLREKSVVTIEVFDILGRKIRSLVSEEQKNSGLHTVVWDGLNSYGEFVSSGIYIYRIRANDFIDSKKMMLLK